MAARCWSASTLTIEPRYLPTILYSRLFVLGIVRHDPTRGSRAGLTHAASRPDPSGPSVWSGPSRSPWCVTTRCRPIAFLLAALFGHLGTAPAWKAATRPRQTSPHAGHRHGAGPMSDRECPCLTARSGMQRARASSFRTSGAAGRARGVRTPFRPRPGLRLLPAASAPPGGLQQREKARVRRYEMASALKRCATP